ncbi:hypothetical protein [Mucilaginibacter sp. CSA2-8R]|uniref:hypothetical protein n=1 Tax=Mucilaginibacter sp. CSA2-8R TaxID=3141542 RepID=UPI00315D1D0F
MKLKIFNIKALLLCSLLVAVQGSFAQQNKADSDKDFDKQMQKLQGQMRDLQKQVQKLQMKKLKEKSAELQKLSKELTTRALAHVDDFNISGADKGLGITVVPNLEGLGKITPHVYTQLNSLRLSPNVYNFKFDEKSLQEKVQNGEIKEKTKIYSKSYNVDADDKLTINNAYGKVTVNTWSKNEVKVDVQMMAYANEEEDAQKLLDNISIQDSKENSVISFKTSIAPTMVKNTNTNVIGAWFSSGKSYTRKMVINYTVYMPAKSQLDVTNKFGNVILPNLSGKVNIALTSGALISQELNNPEIRLTNGDAKISTMNNGAVNITYGSLDLGTANNIKARVVYGGMNVDRLKTNGDLAAVYGNGIKVLEVDKNCKNLNIKATYTKVNLGVKDDYDFDVTTTLGSFDYDKNVVKVINTTPEENTRHYSTTRTFKGQVNKGNPDKAITIKSTYSQVKFD